MANPNTPFGFEYLGVIDGLSPNFGLRTVDIDPTNTNSIYGGDVASVIADGFYDVAMAVPGGEQIGGIFVPYFEWVSKTTGMTVRNRAWLGQTGDIVAGGTLKAKIAIHPQSLFRVRSRGNSGGAVTAADIGKNANFYAGAGPGNNLISTFSLDDGTLDVGPSLPFTIYSIDPNPPSDPTAQYNSVVVRFNNQVV